MEGDSDATATRLKSKKQQVTTVTLPYCPVHLVTVLPLQHASYEDAGESDHEAIGSHEDSDCEWHCAVAEYVHVLYCDSLSADLSGDDTAAAAAASGGVKSKAYHSDEEEDGECTVASLQVSLSGIKCAAYYYT